MKKIANISEKISFVLLCVLMIDCTILGFSAWGHFGPIASRMLTMLLCIFFAIPTLLLNFKSVMKNKYFVPIIVFTIVLGIGAIVGIGNNHRLSLVIRDIKGFSCLAILPVALVLINSKARIERLMKCMMIGSTAAASYSIVSLIIYINDKSKFWDMSVQYSKVAFAYYGFVSDAIARLFYQSCVYLICGCAFAVYFYVTEKKKTKWVYPIMIGICLFAMLITYTRSVYLAAFIAAVLLIILFIVIGSKEQHKEMIKCIVASVIVFAVILCAFGIPNKADYIRFAIMRSASGMGDMDSTEVDTEDISGEEAYLEQTQFSDNIREATLKGLYRNIKKNPITGIGLGAEFKERPEGVNEYVYLDMISKVGIIGLFIYAIPFIIMLRRLWNLRKEITMQKAQPAIFMFILIGFVVFSHFNPYMNGALGIFFYCCTIGSVNWLEKDLEKSFNA